MIIDDEAVREPEALGDALLVAVEVATNVSDTLDAALLKVTVYVEVELSMLKVEVMKLEV